MALQAIDQVQEAYAAGFQDGLTAAKLVREQLRLVKAGPIDEPRDDHGRWTSDGGGSLADVAPSGSSPAEWNALLGHSSADVKAREAARGTIAETLGIPTSKVVIAPGEFPDPAQMRTAAASMKLVVHDYPALKGSFGSVKFTHIEGDGVLADTGLDHGKIVMEIDTGKAATESFDEAITSHWAPDHFDGLGTVVIHEMGHAVGFLDGNEGSIDTAIDFVNTTENTHLASGSRIDMNALSFPSGYARSTFMEDPREFFADGFAANYLGSKWYGGKDPVGAVQRSAEFFRGLEAKDAKRVKSESPLLTKWADLQKYNEDELRDERGRWSSGGDLVTPGGTSSYTPEQMAAVEAQREKLGLPSQDQLRAVYSSIYSQATPDQLARGEGWYEHVHGEAEQLSRSGNTSPEIVAAIIARCSPGREWGSNEAAAEAVITTLSQNQPFQLTQEKSDALRDPLPPGTYRPSDLTPEQLAWAHPAFDGIGASPDTTRQLADSIRLWRGDTTPDDVLTGPKTRSFFNNIADPTDKHSVTLDSWMFKSSLKDLGDDHYRVGTATLGATQLGSAITRAPTSMKLGLPPRVGLYPYYAQAIIDNANAVGLTPSQYQAVVWTVARERKN